MTRAVCLLAALCALPAAAEIDVKAAMPALLRVLGYDTNFEARGNGPFTVVVVSDAAQASQREAVATLKELKIKSRPVVFVALEFKDEAALQAEVEKSKASAVLLVPGTSMATVKHAWDVAQDNQLYALGLEAAMVEQVLPVGVTLAGDKPQIVINEKAAAAVGVRFETSVLKVARVIH